MSSNRLFLRASSALAAVAAGFDRNTLKPAALQTRDAPTMETLARAVEQMRQSNDEAIKLRMTKDQVDPLIEERTKKLNDNIDAVQRQLDEIVTKFNRSGAPAAKDKDGNDIPGADPEYRKQFNDWLRRGADTPELQKRAMTAGSNVEGGYITSPEIDTEITRFARTDGNLRAVANVRQISGGSYSKPTANNDNAAGWVAELEGRPVTQAVTFGGVTIQVHECYAMPAATQTLLDDAWTNVESLIAEETNEAFWELEAQAWIDGSGNGRPQGLILPSGKITVETGSTAAVQGKLGVVKSGSASALISGSVKVGDGLIAVQTRLKSRYLSNARWRMNRFTLAEVRKLKDQNDQYVWQPGLTAGVGSTILGYPVDTDDHMPAIADGAIPILFGDFRAAYTIVDRMGIRMLRDPYSSKPYVLFYTTKRVGGGYIKTEAMKGYQTAT